MQCLTYCFIIIVFMSTTFLTFFGSATSRILFFAFFIFAVHFAFLRIFIASAPYSITAFCRHSLKRKSTFLQLTIAVHTSNLITLSSMCTCQPLMIYLNLRLFEKFTLSNIVFHCALILKNAFRILFFILFIIIINLFSSCICMQYLQLNS